MHNIKHRGSGHKDDCKSCLVDGAAASVCGGRLILRTGFAGTARILRRHGKNEPLWCYEGAPNPAPALTVKAHNVDNTCKFWNVVTLDAT